MERLDTLVCSGYGATVRQGRPNAARAGATAEDLQRLAADPSDEDGSSSFQDGRPSWPLVRLLPVLRRAPDAEWLVEYTDAIARHVETLLIESPLSAQRNLTIDVLLPPRGIRRSTWVLPVTRLAKADPTSFIDLSNERGVTIALPTRRECNTITYEVLLPELLEIAQSDRERHGIEAALKVLVHQIRPEHAQIGLSFIEAAIARNSVVLSARLEETLNQLVDNSIVWLPITGAPGQRKLVKLSYHIKLQAPVVPARKPRTHQITLSSFSLPASRPDGRIAYRRTLRRARARVTARMGWDAIDLYVDEPVLQDPRTYHLQVSPPPGLHVTEIDVDVDDAKRPKQVSDSNRHLYIRSRRPRMTDVIRIKMRAERRGFVNASLVSALALSLLLWLFAAKSGAVTKDADVAPGAAVLLIAPALMALFVSRPTESALVAATLTGIRTALGSAAIASLLGAAALSGARATNHAGPTLWSCAGVATASALSIGAAWLGTFHFVRKHGNRARRFWCGAPDTRRTWALAAGAASCFALAFWGVALLVNGVHATRHPWVMLILLTAVPVLALRVWLPQRDKLTEPRSTPPGIVALTLVAGFAAIGLATAVAVTTHLMARSVPGPVGVVAASIGGSLALLGLFAALSAELAPMESPTSWPLERR
jgi:hypothetical protein